MVARDFVPFDPSISRQHRDFTLRGPSHQISKTSLSTSAFGQKNPRLPMV